MLLCIGRTGHSPITEGSLLLLSEYRLLFLFFRDKVVHSDNRLPWILLSITRLGVLAFVIIVHWLSTLICEIVILALLRRRPAISIIILIKIGGTRTYIGLYIIALFLCDRTTLSRKAIAIVAIVLNNFLATTFAASMHHLFRYFIIPYHAWTFSVVSGGLFAKERWPFVEKVITGATFTFISHCQARSLCVVHLAISAVFTVRMRLSNDSFRSILVFGLLELRVCYEVFRSDYTI